MKHVFPHESWFPEHFKSETWGAPLGYTDPNSYPETFYTNKVKSRNKLLKHSTTSYVSTKKLPAGGVMGHDDRFHYHEKDRNIREISPGP